MFEEIINNTKREINKKIKKVLLSIVDDLEKMGKYDKYTYLELIIKYKEMIRTIERIYKFD